MAARIILASASPRRKELLDQIKVTYAVNPVDLDETPRLNETPLAYVRRLAAEKSAACMAQIGSASTPVLAADTAVVLGNLIMGKPKDQDDALSMLSQLSGKTHQVYTAISLRGRRHHQAVSITQVSFRPLTKQEMLAYWHSGEPVDKAGSYAVQGLAALFIELIQGSYSGIMGLPIRETGQLLMQMESRSEQ